MDEDSDTTSTHDELGRRYRHFADQECGEYSPLYFQLAHAVAGNRELLKFIASMPERQPNLFFAAIQYLTGPEEMPGNGAELSAFVEGHREELASIMRSRRTQTNETGRCAALLPALPSGPLALIEVGASAGLCLLLDQFLYDYDGVQLGREDSGVEVRCTGNGSIPLPSGMPNIVWRQGLDRNPIDLKDPQNARWLLSCVWADQPERRRRLAATMEMARTCPPTVVRGDLVDNLPALLASVPPPEQATLVVFHSAVLTYVEAARRNAFVELLSTHSLQREIIWISNEGPNVFPMFDAMAPARDLSRFRLVRTRFTNARRESKLLALVHPHGLEIEWLE